MIYILDEQGLKLTQETENIDRYVLNRPIKKLVANDSLIDASIRSNLTTDRFQVDAIRDDASFPSDPLVFLNDVVFRKSLTTYSDKVDLDVSELTVYDSIIEFNKGETDSGVFLGEAGMEAHRNLTDPNEYVKWLEDSKMWEISGSGAVVKGLASSTIVNPLIDVDTVDFVLRPKLDFTQEIEYYTKTDKDLDNYAIYNATNQFMPMGAYNGSVYEFRFIMPGGIAYYRGVPALGTSLTLFGESVGTDEPFIRMNVRTGTVWSAFQPPTQNGLKTVNLPKTAHGSTDGGFFSYYFHSEAWSIAFSNQSVDGLISQTGSVYKDSISEENLVVRYDGAVGPAGILSISSNKLRMTVSRETPNDDILFKLFDNKNGVLTGLNTYHDRYNGYIDTQARFEGYFGSNELTGSGTTAMGWDYSNIDGVVHVHQNPGYRIIMRRGTYDLSTRVHMARGMLHGQGLDTVINVNRKNIGFIGSGIDGIEYAGFSMRGVDAATASVILPVNYGTSGTDINLSSPSGDYNTFGNFLPCKASEISDAKVGNNTWRAFSLAAGSKVSWSGVGAGSYGAVRFATDGSNNWSDFASSDLDGLKTFRLPATGNGEVDGGYYEYNYVRSAFVFAFSGNQRDIVVAQNGSVYAENVSEENLVVAWDGTIGSNGGGATATPDVERREFYYTDSLFSLRDVSRSEFSQKMEMINASYIYDASACTYLEFGDMVDNNAVCFKDAKKSKYRGFYKDNVGVWDNCEGIANCFLDDGSTVLGFGDFDKRGVGYMRVGSNFRVY